MMQEGSDGASFPFAVCGTEVMYGQALTCRAGEIRSRHVMAWLYWKISDLGQGDDRVEALTLLDIMGHALDAHKGENRWQAILSEVRAKQQPPAEPAILEVVDWTPSDDVEIGMRRDISPIQEAVEVVLMFVNLSLDAPGEIPARVDDPMVLAEADWRMRCEALMLESQCQEAMPP
jgi:hypothetical protein